MNNFRYICTIIVLFLAVFINAQPDTVASGFTSDPYSLALNGDDLFIGTADGISKVNITASSTDVQTVMTDSGANFVQIALSGNTLYAVSASEQGKIISVNISDNTATDFITTGLMYPSGLAISGNELFISDDDSRIVKFDLTDSSQAPTVVATGLDSPTLLTINDNTLYISERDKISSLDITANTPTTTQDVITGLTTYRPHGTALGNENYLYVSGGNSGNLFRYDLTTPSENPTTIGGNLTFIYDVLINGTDLYVVENQNRGVYAFNDSTLSLVRNNIPTSNKGITTYPNPAINELNISGMDRESSFTVHDQNGRTIIRNREAGTNRRINVSGLSSGPYFLRASGKGKAKFIKN